MKALKGDWVEIERIVLLQSERDQNIPEDTRKVPLTSYIQGFLEEESAVVGEEVTIKSVISRLHSGVLINIDPEFTHHFGKPVAELLYIGQELKALLEPEAGRGSS